LQKYPIYFKFVILIVEAIRASLADTTAREKEEDRKCKLGKR
jgi:hypothetical protein